MASGIAPRSGVSILLAALGVPNIDNLGARGNYLHSPEEYLEIDSLPERARLLWEVLNELNDRLESWGQA